MKKIILSTLFLVILASCKKENTIVNGNTSVADSTSVSESPGNESATLFANEIAPENLNQYLGKDNDTLYITNFFATWCGPCLREIPHFKNKMEELKGKPVKFTFVSVDDKSEWGTSVKEFGEKNNLTNHIVLLDGKKLDQNFFTANFKQWDGGSIPFTYMKKGNKTDEFLGMMTEEVLNSKINSFIK
ncbi:TlpA disulfide reductase family protein [Chryseobacterium sp.]|uniref:TlpA family protein disulfide reductase n=1 Tax=Chryseobacterium sp. TaxID=1871047 RepID=UPI0025C166DD|nr:TlpA disulfide reductase family protein [Chryseobacterium sp.]